MSISAEQLQVILEQQQKQFEHAQLLQQKQFEQTQLKLLETLTKNLSIQTPEGSKSEPSISSADSIANSITEFNFDSHDDRTFDAWFKRYQDIFKVDFAKQDDPWKVRLLLRKLGTREHNRYLNYILPKQPSELSFDDTIQTLTQIFGDNTSLFNIRYQCLKLAMKDDDFFGFTTIVNRECERFKLSSMDENQFKCLIFISGIQSSHHTNIRTRLLHQIEQNPRITLQELSAECHRLIQLNQDSTMIGQSSSSSHNIVHHVSSNKKVFQRHSNHKNNKPSNPCWSCGDWHYVRFCPFKTHRCQTCHRTGHKEGFCFPQRTKPIDYRKSAFKTATTSQRKRSQSNSIFASFKVDFASRRKFITVSVNNHPVRLQLDTASDITLISRSTWNAIGKPLFSTTNHCAQSASGNILSLIGELTCDVSFNNSQFKGMCYLTDCSDLNLLGLDWIDKLNLFCVPLHSVCDSVHFSHTSISQQLTHTLQSKFSSVFQDSLGHCSKAQATLHLKPASKPVFRPKRPVPYAALASVDAELDRLQSSGVIQPVNYSPWAAPIVVVKKANGKVRICADYSTGLNAALDSHQYPLPVPEDLFTKLNGGTCFAKLDLADAYLQIEVANDSKNLLTINTHRGLYQFNRLPFGVKTAPAIFQQIMDAMLNGLTGVAAYLDDIIVAAVDQDELLHRLTLVLDRIQEYGLHLRAEKCAFFLASIKYLGFIFDKSGRYPDPDNICAIQKMPPPTDVSSLRSFLGLVSHYSTFLPDMHRVRVPLNHLLKKDVLWNWSPQCQSSFDTVKSLLSSDLLLTHYNPSMDIILASDASNYGIGAVISHRFPDGNEKAIAHAARSLAPAERNYSQIEKEALAIVFAVKKFHKMIYGRHFTLLTDHKPLVSIFGSKKGVPVYTANRLQRWAITLLGYDFSIKYQSTDTIGQADALSRLMDSQRQPTEDTVVASISVEPEVCTVLAASIRALPVTSTMICDETKCDPVLQKVLHYHHTRWPSSVPSDLQSLFHRRFSLSEVHGCLLFGDRVIIPTKIQARVLKQFHFGHPGINRMKALARSYVYWPGMDRQIEELVQSCSKCQLSAKSPRKTELSSWPAPTNPWSRLHIDFAGPINNQHYLILVDAYSKWPEVIMMDRITSRATILQLTRIFSRFGTPETLISDNGSAFTSSEFAEFCKQNGIKHIRSPPFHPQSNGQVERFVDTFKRALQKLKGEGTPADIIETFLLSYRATPNVNVPNNYSPAEALFGRKLRLPIDVIRPSPRHTQRRNTHMERQFNRHHGAIPTTYKPGDAVLAKDYRNGGEKWTHGYVKRRVGNVIYEIDVQSSTWVRHANQLRPTHAAPATSDDSIPLDILLDTFELPSTHVSPVQTDQPPVEPIYTSRRWSSRTPKPVTRMQVNPHLKTYTIQKGRC